MPFPVPKYNDNFALRLVLGANIVLIPILDIAYAIFPNTEIGKDAYSVLAEIFSFSLIALFVCCGLYFAEQVFRSHQHWKKVRHEPSEPFLLDDKCVVIFSGWIKPPFFICFYFLLCAPFVPILAFVVNLLSLGTLGFVPSFNQIP
jgi:hypothetical protein